MSLDKPESLAIDGKGISVGIIAARYNFNLVNELLETVVQTLHAGGVNDDDIEVFRVPGSNEVPHAAALAAKTGDFDVIIGLGLIISGGTRHDEIIGHASANALHQASLQFEVPIINGIITVNNLEQAEERITGSINRGPEFAQAALEMARFNKEMMPRVISRDLFPEMDAEDWLDDDDDDDDDGEWPR